MFFVYENGSTAEINNAQLSISLLSSKLLHTHCTKYIFTRVSDMHCYTVLYFFASRTGTGGVYPEMIMEKINNLPDYQVNAKPQE